MYRVASAVCRRWPATSSGGRGRKDHQDGPTAIKRAGSLDHKAIRDALAATSGWKDASGVITYPPGERIPSKSVALIEVKDGKFNLLSIVVPTKIHVP